MTFDNFVTVIQYKQKEINLSENEARWAAHKLLDHFYRNNLSNELLNKFISRSNK